MISSAVVSHGTNNATEGQEYYTDEEELARETFTEWTQQKGRSYKKRKAESSPETQQAITSKTKQGEKGKDQKQEIINEQSMAGCSISSKKTTGKINKFPPFNLINVNCYNVIKEIIQMLNKEPAPKIVKGAEGKYKINVYNEEDFREMPYILEKKGIEWFNYENKHEKPNKVVMRGLDGSIDVEKIKIALIEMGFKMIEVSNIQVKKDDCHNAGNKIMIKAPLHMLTFKKTKTSRKSLILNIFYILR